MARRCAGLAVRPGRGVRHAALALSERGRRRALTGFPRHRPNATVYYPATIPTCSSPVQPDTAHEPPLAYVPWLLTGDPYYLEELQFAATFNVLCAVPGQRGNYCIGFALRAHAWALRVLAQVRAGDARERRRAGCSRVPYWQEWLNTRGVVDRGPLRQADRAAVHGGALRGLPAFMAERRRLAGNHRNWRRAPTLQPVDGGLRGGGARPCRADEDTRGLLVLILEWKLANTVARTNGSSGWVRARTTPYTMPLRETEDAPYAADWPAVWGLNVAMQPPEFVDFDDPDVIPPGASLTYASYTMSALAMAATLGVEGAAEAHAWLRGQIEANSDDNTYVDRKWSISG